MPKKKNVIRGKQYGLFDKFADYFKLIWRLWQDERINPLLKLLPLGSIVYFLIPFDIPGPFDDAAAIWFMTQLFIEMSPPHIVEEHRIAIEKEIIADWKQAGQEEINEEDIVDADYKDKEKES